jgi:glycerophosphoryl diester phosphodiesterase
MPPDQRPLLIAHRYGNKLPLIDEAARAGADVIEVDVWYHRGTIQVGHDKTLGPIPLRWDRWSLALGHSRPLSLPQVLRLFPANVRPMLDLKGTDPRLPAAVQAIAQQHLPERDYMVSSQNWDYLQQFLDTPTASVVRSAGTPQALRRLQDDFADWPGDGGGLNHKLITPGDIEALRHHTALVLTWTVNTIELANQLTADGVTGIITDNLELIRTIRAQHPDSPSSE